MADVTPTAKTKDRFLPGIGVGFLLGALTSCVIGNAGTSGGSSTGATTTAPATVAAIAEPPAAPAVDQLPVTLGRGTREYGRTQYPIVVENGTGADQRYIQATCTFYAKGDQVVASEFTNWTNVPAGAKVSGNLRVEPADAERYECRASTS